MVFEASIIPIVAIPLSLIGAFIIMLALGFSINLLSLLAMVLAIGLVVDDAIIVVENIHRHINEGSTPFDAAIQGARELAGPVVAIMRGSKCVVGDGRRQSRRFQPGRRPLWPLHWRMWRRSGVQGWSVRQRPVQGQSVVVSQRRGLLHECLL